MNRTIVITGSSDGIGAAAARQLHRDGHQVVVVGRSPEKTAAVAESLGADSFVADFTRLDDVRKLAAELDGRYERIDVLANNAGGVFGDRVKTVDGFEKTFQINHLAPFLLTRLLMPKLITSRATLIQTSSVAARLAGRLDLDDLDHDRSFRPIQVYGAAKLENILFTRELHRRYHDQGVSSVAFHPGSVASSFGSTTTSRLMKVIVSNPLVRQRVLITPEQGAAQLIRFASSPDTFESGRYYERGRPTNRTTRQAFDDDLARGLWDRSEHLLGA